MNLSKPKVVSFISGKGGSGKTTVAISIAKLLSDIGYSCLLIDFDLSTNGASYFFKPYFKTDDKGFWEVLSTKPPESRALPKLLEELFIKSIKISNNFSFIPSRVNLGSKGASYESLAYSSKEFEVYVLAHLIRCAEEEEISYILIDGQAGYTQTSEAATAVADMIVVVAEADNISSDASENVLQQFEKFGGERKYLINKVDVRDADTYRYMRDAFQALNRLPPLPFDFEVRAAFGARRIPLDVNEPSSLLFALFETTKYIFTEIFEELEKYKREKIDSLFERYDQEMDELIADGKNVEDQIIRIKTRDRQFRLSTFRLATIGLLVALVFGTFAFAIESYRFDTEQRIAEIELMTGSVTLEEQKFAMRLLREELERKKLVDTVFAGSGGFILIVFGALAMRAWRRRLEVKGEHEIELDALARREEKINRELDQFRSLIWVRSRELLVESEIAKAHGKRESAP